MKILFLGDVVARSGRTALRERLPVLKAEFQADFIIVNGENAAHGKGITERIYKAFKEAGADVITLGNHAFSKSEILNKINDCPDLVRPVNLVPRDRGSGYLVRCVNGRRIAVVNLLGGAYMDCADESPFTCMQHLLPELKRCSDIRIVDLHAEATSEKELFFYMFQEEVTAVIGTHTHVQTADEQIRAGCGYITDVGMCGPFDSILGRDPQEVMRRTLKNEATHYTPSEAPAMVCGVVLDIDEETCRTRTIVRFQERPDGQREVKEVKVG
jgi:metallophosphoesterase (TIGR00282 family)